MEIGLDLTKTKIKKINEFQIIKESNFNIEEVKESSKNIGLDLTKGKKNDKIDLIKYGKDIE